MFQSVLCIREVVYKGMQSQRKEFTDFFPGDFSPLFVNISQVMQFRIMRSPLNKYFLKDQGMVVTFCRNTVQVSLFYH